MARLELLDFKGWLQALPINIRLKQKLTVLANTLAYCISKLLMAVKSFKVVAPGEMFYIVLNLTLI